MQGSPMRLGYHAPHEQFPPEQLLRFLKAAERAGFHDAMCSDHLSPFLPEQGHSGHAWTWLGAAAEATNMTLGTVSAPGQRYHPVVLAQAAATVARLAPGRFWLALGSGEAVNEHVTGDPWPPKAQRNERLLQCQEVMRSLLRGDEVSRDGLVRVDRARLWSVPQDPPPLLGAALSPETAGLVAGWADGLITVNQPRGRLEQIVRAYRDNGGRGPLQLQVQLSWHPDEQEALRAAHREWRFCTLESDQMENLETPEDIEAATRGVEPGELRGPVAVMDDLGRLADLTRTWADLGFDTAYLHNVGRNQLEFIEAAGEALLAGVPAHA